MIFGLAQNFAFMPRTPTGMQQQEQPMQQVSHQAGKNLPIL
jgi:hypothetical protein